VEKAEKASASALQSQTKLLVRLDTLDSLDLLGRCKSWVGCNWLARSGNTNDVAIRRKWPRKRRYEVQELEEEE